MKMFAKQTRWATNRMKSDATTALLLFSNSRARPHDAPDPLLNVADSCLLRSPTRLQLARCTNRDGRRARQTELASSRIVA